MTKSCKICGAEFDTHDSRTVTCGAKDCANKSRSLTNSLRTQVTNKPVTRYLRKEDLPLRSACLLTI